MQNEELKQDLNYIIQHPDQLQKKEPQEKEQLKSQIKLYISQLKESFIDKVELRFEQFLKKQDHLEHLNKVQFMENDSKMNLFISKMKRFGQIVRKKEKSSRTKLEKLGIHLEELGQINQATRRKEKEKIHKFKSLELELKACKKQLFNLKLKMDKGLTENNPKLKQTSLLKIDSSGLNNAKSFNAASLGKII